MVKACIPPSISEKSVGRILQKTHLKGDHFQRKRMLTKYDLKLRVKFTQKVCRKRAMCSYEI